MPTVATPPTQADFHHYLKERRGWPLERVLFLMAATMTGLSALLSALVSLWFLLLTGFVAINQLAFVAFGNCPSSLALRRWFGFRSASEL